MKTQTIGKQTIFTDTNNVGLVETGIPKIAFPMSFTSEYFTIDQEFHCDADKVPKLAHGISHSKYPNSKLIQQTPAQIKTAGLASFTRKYVQFPSGIIEQASTATVTYPSIAIGANYSGRGIQTIKVPYQTPSNQIDTDGNPVMITNYRDVPAVTNWYRKNNISKVVPVIIQTSFVYLGSTLQESYTRASEITTGTRIQGRIVTSKEEIDDGNRIQITFENGETTVYSAYSSVRVELFVYNPSAIQVDEPFKIIDQYEGHSGAEVEFIDDFTSPNRNSFLSSANQDKLLFSSQITHISGHLYMKKNIYGKIQ